MKRIRLLNFAKIAEFRGTSDEWIETLAETPAQLHHELSLPFSLRDLRVAVNHEFAGTESALRDGDVVAFLTPFAGG
jgi:molybdopterin converting factor small subunit